MAGGALTSHLAPRGMLPGASSPSQIESFGSLNRTPMDDATLRYQRDKPQAPQAHANASMSNVLLSRSAQFSVGFVAASNSPPDVPRASAGGSAAPEAPDAP